MEFSDERIVDIKEARWVGTKTKELRLKIELPDPPRVVQSGCPEIRHVCHYEYTGRVQTRHDDFYYQVVGRWGPFIATYWLLERAPVHDPKNCHTMAFQDWCYSEEPPPKAPLPWMSPMTEKGRQDFWMGLWCSLEEAQVSGRYVSIGYSSTRFGNGFQTYINAEYLEYLLVQHNLPWKVVPNPHRAQDASLEPAELKPFKVGQKVYQNGHNKLTFGAQVTWSPDDWARAEDVFLGAYWPSEAEAQKAIDQFVEAASANPEARLHTLSKTLSCGNPKVLQERFPQFECPPDLK